jgi:two-component system CheB/CheR fusion protein
LEAAREEILAMKQKYQPSDRQSETSREMRQPIDERLNTLSSQLLEKVHELEAANKDLTNLLGSTGIATLFLDSQFGIRHYTPAATRLFDLFPTDIGRPIGEISHRLTNGDLLNAAATVLETGEPVEGLAGTEDGGRYIRRILPYRTLDGRVAGVVATFVDVSEHGQVRQAPSTHRGHSQGLIEDGAEASARTSWQPCDGEDGREPVEAEGEGLFERVESEAALLKTVLKQLPVGVVIAEAPSGRLLMGNDELERILGQEFIACDSLEEWDVYCGFHPDGRRYRPEEWPLARAIRTGEVVEREEIEFLRGDESRGLMHLSAAPIRDADGRITGGVVVLEDVTGQKRAERRAQEHEAELAHAGRLSVMGEMVSAIAHEISQPLTAIVTYGESCLQMLKSERADARQMRQILEEVVAQGLRAGEIIRTLKRLARKEQPSCTPADINALVRRVAGLILPEARQQEVDMRLLLSEPLPQVQVEPVQIEQVLLNLIRNGIESMSGVDAGARTLTIETTGDRDKVWVSVSDTGPGLSAATKGQIFKPFFTTKHSGLGLGLSISRSIVEAHGGRLELDAAGRQGGRFYFDLPTAAGDGP